MYSKSFVLDSATLFFDVCSVAGCSERSRVDNTLLNDRDGRGGRVRTCLRERGETERKGLRGVEEMIRLDIGNGENANRSLNILSSVVRIALE